MRSLATLCATGLSVALAAGALAQVPRGHGVFSRLYVPGGYANEAGFTIFAPYGDLTVDSGPGFTLVTGVPAALATRSEVVGGANCVLVDDDGSLWAGQYTASGAVSIYHLILDGAHVRRFDTFPIGNVAPTAAWGAVHQMDWLPDGRIVFATGYVAGSGLDPLHAIGILDPATGSVQPIQIVPLPANPQEWINALAAKRDGTAAYFGIYRPYGTVPRTTIHEIPLSGSGVATPIPLGDLPDGPYQLDVDHTGLIYVSCFNQGLFTVDPATGTVTHVVVGDPGSPTHPYRQLNGLTIDEVSGDVFFIRTAVTLFPTVLYRMTPGSAPVVVPGLTPPLATVFDAVSGMAIRPSMTSIGSQAGVPAPPMQWQIAPNPGGPPVLGNLDFSLTLETSANPTASALLLSFAPAPVPIPAPFGTELLLDVRLLVPAPMLPAGPNELRTDAALPPVPVMCWMEWYAQSFHIVGGGLVSSPVVSFMLQ